MSPIRQKVKFDKKLLDQDALKILKKLNKSGHETYLVWGCIRDILLGHKPKDFDIATSATPEQIHKLFKRSRIIGRRFKLVHIMFSARKFIEVATFRAGKVQTSNDGLVLRDNYYGTLEDDVFRRDFTVNGLYYDIKKSEVIVYDGWLEDYKYVFDMMNDYVTYKDQVLSECIFLTHNFKKHTVNVSRHPETEVDLWVLDKQELKRSQYGGENVRYKLGMKSEYIRQFKQLHNTLIPWNTIRYIF